MSTTLVKSQGNPQHDIIQAWENDLILTDFKGKTALVTEKKSSELEEIFRRFKNKIGALNGETARQLVVKIEADLNALSHLSESEQREISSYTWQYRVICYQSSIYQIMLNNGRRTDIEQTDLTASIMLYLRGVYRSGLINTYRKTALTSNYHLIEDMLARLVIGDRRNRERFATELMDISRMGEFANNQQALKTPGAQREMVGHLLYEIEALESGLFENDKPQVEQISILHKRNLLREKYVRLIEGLDWSEEPEIENEEAVISFFQGAESLFRSAQFGESVELSEINWHKAEPLLIDVTSHLQEGINPILGKSSDTRRLNKQLAELGQLLLHDLPLDEYNQWWIDADGLLNALPFEALKDPEGSFWLQSVRFRYKRGEPMANQRLKEAVTYLRGTFTDKSLELPHLQAEEQAIKGGIKEVHAVKDLKEMGKSEMLYAATHQVWKQQEPVLLLNEKDSVFRNDIYRLAHLPKAVMLNACASMAGLAVSGEGTQSMGQRMLEAGASQLIASLWAVEDASSAELGVRYLSALKSRQSSSKSLATAKKGYLEEADSYYSHPFFWSSLLHYGADVELEGRQPYHLLWFSLVPLFMLVRWKLRVYF